MTKFARVFTEEEQKLITSLPLLQDLTIATRESVETVRCLRNDLDCQVRQRQNLEKRLAEANVTIGSLTQQLNKALVDAEQTRVLNVTLRHALDTITES